MERDHHQSNDGNNPHQKSADRLSSKDRNRNISKEALKSSSKSNTQSNQSRSKQQFEDESPKVTSGEVARKRATSQRNLLQENSPLKMNRKLLVHQNHLKAKKVNRLQKALLALKIRKDC
jgi:hypothetical protein